ncbi:MAG: zinc ribbon domain-containing protein [Clostridiales Family XIII bacterium]|jgi:RNA polymerase subunit RPABC4/transcription elongation factor Spt4|nr:zinc ribbon domain-containing protein [Clostridiales Family XIII bacterium]
MKTLLDTVIALITLGIFIYGLYIIIAKIIAKIKTSITKNEPKTQDSPAKPKLNHDFKAIDESGVKPEKIQESPAKKPNRNLIQCKECGKEISKKATLCPHCGTKYRHTSAATWFVLIIFVICFVILSRNLDKIAISSPSNPNFDRAYYAYKQLEKKVNDPDSLKVDKAMVVEGGFVCINFRAKNGFGGVIKGQAVHHSGQQLGLITSEDKGFYEIWNLACNGKSGDSFQF